jgi:hypothetical protein
MDAEAPAETETETENPNPSPSPAATTDASENPEFQALDRALKDEGPAAALDRLVDHLDRRGEYRALLDALLLKARHELGMPLVQEGNLAEIEEPLRSEYEARYVEAIRTVGARLLGAGDIAGAWPYYRAIGETEPVAGALEAYRPAEEDERLGAVIDVAFNQGAHPRRGFELILESYGTCSAITAFQHLGPDEANRRACAERLVGRLHEDLVASLRAEIAQRGQPLPPEGTPIPDLIAGRPWLFAEDAYHIDLSHLGSVVRIALLAQDRDALEQAVGLAEYGRHLSPRHRMDGEPPFEDHYEDHAVYLRALIGGDADREAAIAHFRGKLAPETSGDDAVADGEGGGEFDGGRGGPMETYPAQILVGLLLRLGRLDEAIDVAAEHLAGLPDSALTCPSVAQLCQRAGQPGRLARIARAHGDLVRYAAAILQAGAGAGTGTGPAAP